MDVQQLRARNRFDVTLRSGLSLTIEIPNMLDCMIAVNIPVPVLEHLRQVNEAAIHPNGKQAKALSLEELGHVRAANIEGLRRAVKALEGTVLEVPLTTEDVLSGFTDDEQEELLEYLNRKRTDPKAGAPT